MHRPNDLPALAPWHVSHLKRRTSVAHHLSDHKVVLRSSCASAISWPMSAMSPVPLQWWLWLAMCGRRHQRSTILAPASVAMITPAGRRDLPLLPLAADMLDIRRAAQAADNAELGRAWLHTGLMFNTRTGRPVEPRNLIRSFHRICVAWR